MATATAALSSSELVLGRYRPLQPLGSGGSGSVWLARDEIAGVDVALKIMAREGKAAERAEREASAAARLRHERCQRVYALAHDDEHVYIAYEYIAGETLRHALRSGKLDDGAAIEAAAQILEGLAHAHECGIVHRDIKPSNVLVADEDELSIRLLDFGLAVYDGADTLTAAGDVPGTLAYISPERLKGRPAGPAADVWAVGVLLWEALAGWHPFFTSSMLGTAKKIATGAPPLRQARPDLPRELDAVVCRMLARDPTRRPPAARLAAALRAVQRQRVSRPPPKSALPTLPSPTAALPAAGAAVLAGWGAHALPFFPAGWPWVLAAVAAALTFALPRAGLAFALAVPILPIGNLSLGLAFVYALFAAVWLGVSWRRPRSAFFPVLGPLLAPLAALGLLPLASLPLRGAVYRFLAAGLAVVAAGLVAGMRGAPLPVTGEPAGAVDVERLDSAVEAGRELVGAVPTSLAIVAVVLGLTSALLPLALRRGPAAVAALGATMLAAVLSQRPAGGVWLAAGLAMSVALPALAPHAEEIRARARALGKQAEDRFGTLFVPRQPHPVTKRHPLRPPKAG